MSTHMYVDCGPCVQIFGGKGEFGHIDGEGGKPVRCDSIILLLFINSIMTLKSISIIDDKPLFSH